jgi:hypothetical protein
MGSSGSCEIRQWHGGARVLQNGVAAAALEFLCDAGEKLDKRSLGIYL